MLATVVGTVVVRFNLGLRAIGSRFWLSGGNRDLLVLSKLLTAGIVSAILAPNIAALILARLRAPDCWRGSSFSARNWPPGALTH